MRGEHKKLETRILRGFDRDSELARSPDAEVGLRWHDTEGVAQPSSQTALPGDGERSRFDYRQDVRTTSVRRPEAPLGRALEGRQKRSGPRPVAGDPARVRCQRNRSRVEETAST